MGTRLINRPPRSPGPALPRGEVLLESPPEMPEETGGGLGQVFVLLPMLAGAGAMAFMYAGRGGGVFQYVIGALFGVSMLGMMVGSLGNGRNDKRRELNAERRDYMRYLAQVRRRVRRAAAQQAAAIWWHHPEPEQLWAVVAGPRLWERRPIDEDFGELRVGRGPQRLAISLITPETKPVEDLEPMSAIALRRFVRTHTTVPDLPVAVSLRSFTRIVVDGGRPETLALARAMLIQAVTFHAPDDLVVAVCAAPERLPDWDWVKWLPHAMNPAGTDAAGPLRLVAGSLAQVEATLGIDLTTRPRHTPTTKVLPDEPHVLVVLDGGEIGPESQLAQGSAWGTTVLELSGRVRRDAGRTTLGLRLSDGQLSIVRRSGLLPVGRPDALAPAQAAGLARRLAPLRATASGGPADEPLARDLGLPQLLGLGDPGNFDVAAAWRTRPPRDRLRVPIGMGPDGQPVELDLKEAAQDGMGPHGLVIGATGSGKSELLRTLVLGLAATHSSEVLNFVLIDFKGGATFASMSRLPHTSAVITNLADELTLVDRMKDALTGELVRRQELLRSAGNYASLRDYERARVAGAPLQALPSLLVVCDEFSELLSAKPEFIDLFVMIGRLGRSLGVHLLLASQRLEEGRLRGLDTHLSYRIGLRTFSAVESRIVLGVADAYELPSAPGHGYLKFDTSSMSRFRAAYVSGALPTARPGSRQDLRVHSRVVPYTLARSVEPTPAPGGAPAGSAVGDAVGEPTETVLDVLVARLEGQGPAAHQVWLPPLEQPPTLDQLLPPLTAAPGHGFGTVDWDGSGQLAVPLGVVDRPFEQRRDLLWADLAGGAGHVAVVGAPQSGKSTLVRTLISSLALTHTPLQAQFYCLDFGGGSLAGLRGLPHVGGVAGRRESDLTRRLVAEVTTLLDARERRFVELGIDSMATFRRRRTVGEADPQDPFGDVFLVVDGWGVIREDYDHLESVITSIAARGLGYGVHVVLSAARWMDIRPAMKDLIGTRLELRLGDASDSEVDRKTAASVPARSPGRGVTRDKLHFLGAVPRIDGTGDADDLTAGVEAMVKQVATNWHGDAAPPVRMLPTMFSADDLPVPAGNRPVVPIGIDEATLSPVALDFAADPHFVAFGDTESGKTNLLRLICRSIVRDNAPDRARLIIADYRRTLLGDVEGEHLIGYAPSSSVLGGMVHSAIESMKRRIPGPDVTPTQLRSRSWWTGPDLYVVVDDYDMVATAGSNPLAPLLEFLPQARDIGLHLVLARASGGAGRSLYEPIMQRLNELSTPCLVMSGSKDEGQLFGTVKPRALPPGRGVLARRRHQPSMMHVAWSPSQN